MLRKILVVVAGCFALGCTSAQAQDLALNRPAAASSTQSGRSEFQPTKANDGNSSTRWSSVFSVPQWWRVDLGSRRTIDRVELNWEAAYASGYRIQTRNSLSSGSWSTAANITISSPGLKVHNFAMRTARYVRIVADAKGTEWGVSLWDARVCSNNNCGTMVSDTTPPVATITSGPAEGSSTTATDASFSFTANQPATFECKLDTASFASCASPKRYSGLSVGEHNFQVRAIDTAGNIGSTASRTWTAGSSTPPTGDPPAIAGQGYRKVFEDNFDTYTAGGADWTRDLWWQNDDPADAKFVQNGVLNLVSRRSQGFPGIHTTTLNKHAWQQGYMEARMRWTGGQGAFPGFFLMSQGWANTGACTTPAAEIDIQEGQGNRPFTFFGAIHRHSGTQVNFCGGEAFNTNNVNERPTRLEGNWHTYAVKWTAAQVCWYVDDTLTHCAPTYDTTDDSMLFMILQQDTRGWEPGNTIPSTTNEYRSEYDWVRVWQR
jgi:beta-glucanase (GH16 family)